MSNRASAFFMRGLPAIVLLAAIPFIAACHIQPVTGQQAMAPGRFCLQQWPSDRNAYHQCQQLQSRNRWSFRHFLAQNGLSEADLVQQAAAGDSVAQAAQYCLKQGAPNYERIWRCTQRRVDAASGN